MANFTITIPDDKVSRVRDAFAGEFGWTPDLGITKSEFTRLQIIKFVKNTVKNNEGNLSAGVARTTVDNDVENIMIT